MLARLLFASGLTLSSALVFLPGTALAETVVVSTSADTTLIEFVPGNNLGGADFFNAGTAGNGTRTRALLRFDLSEFIPPGSIITGGQLTMDVVRVPAVGQRNSTFGLHRLFQSWGEGEQVPASPELPGRGSPAQPGEATWVFRFGPDMPWSESGGQTGIDSSTVVSSSAFVTGVGEPVIFPTSTALVADLQWWVDHPEANFGWMLQTESEELSRTARSFAAREGGFGPTLTVEFTAVPEPSAGWLGGIFLLGFVLRIVRGRRNSLLCRRFSTSEHAGLSDLSKDS